MKITSIKSFCVHDETQRSFFIVKVETDTEIHGLGEVGIGRWGSAIAAAVKHLSELLIDEDPLSTERHWQQMFRRGFFPADKVYSCAISAIDIALWDIKGKAFGVPVYKLLGGPVREKVVCYPHNWGANVEELLDSCRQTVDAGWKFVRFDLPAKYETVDGKPRAVLEPRDSIALGLEHVSAVREQFGDELNICIDVHTRLDTANAIDLCNLLDPLRLYFIEDPLRSESPSSYRTLERHTNAPIAAGEQWSSKWDFREVIEEELIRYARIDLCIAGGITEALKITHWCETHFIDIVPHNPLGPVSAAAGVALCMASTNVGVQEMPRAPGTYAKDLFPVQLEFEDGYVRAPDRPGLGVEFNEELAASRAAPMDGWMPAFERRDGSFNNW